MRLLRVLPLVLGSFALAPEASAIYIENCDTMFAARIVERQIAVNAAFPEDCTQPLTNNVGVLNAAGAPMCLAGETANACRARLYDNPPDPLGVLDGACAAGAANCMIGRWSARCTDGTNNCAIPEAICTDGTRPMFHVEPAAGGNSTKWIFWMGGEGGPCVGDKCWINYRYMPSFGSVAASTSLTTLSPDRRTMGTLTGVGIVSGNPVGGANPLAGYNRVRFERCADVTTDGIETVGVPDGVPPLMLPLLPGGGAGAPVETRRSFTTAHHRGFAIWQAVYNMLATNAGRDLNHDGVPDVPSLANATVILNAFSSDAAHWGVFAADRLAAEAQSIAGPEVDVRLLIDGFFPAALDNEGRYSAGAPSPFNLLADGYATTGLCGPLPDNLDGVVNEACSDARYLPGQPLPDVTTSIFARSYMEAQSTLLDASCETRHGAGAAQCYDQIHTLLHHVATPFGVIGDQEDPQVSGVEVVYSDTQDYQWFDAVPYRARVLDAYRDVRDYWSTPDREEGPGSAGDAFMLLRKNAHTTGGSPIHTHFDILNRMLLPIVRCANVGGLVGGTTIARGIDQWVAGTLGSTFMAEDGLTWSAGTPYWYSGNNCANPPE